MEYTSNGYLEIHAYTAEEAVPVPGINVRISGGEEINRGTDFSVMTDRNGETEAVSLPAPAIDYSLSPSAPEQPYAIYDVEIFGTGYYPKKLVGVTVFPGIKSILNLEMVPDAEYSRDVNPPYSTNYTVITEKEDFS